MTVAEAIGIVMALTQFVKKLLPRVFSGPTAVVLTIVISVFVTAYKYVSESLPLDFSALIFLIQVVVGANGAYNLIKVARPKE